MATKSVLIVNGGLGGRLGNTAELLAIAEDRLTPHASVSHLELCREPPLDRILAACESADALLFGTGTYWQSWGSPLQRFFEITAHTEGGPIWRGKPAGAVVTAHATGASGVLSRLLAVLNAYGMLIPPFGGMAYTWVADVAAPVAPQHLAQEIGTPDDIGVVCHNLVAALEGSRDWACWQTVEGRATEKWMFAYSGSHRGAGPK